MIVLQRAVCRHRSTAVWSRHAARNSACRLSLSTSTSHWRRPAPVQPARQRLAVFRLPSITLLALAISLMGAPHVFAAGWPWSQPAELPQQPHPAVARVSVDEVDGTSYGSGTLVDVRDRFALVVTNWHVIRDAAGAIHVIFPDGFRSAARVLRVDRDWDLAALLIWRPPAAPVPLAPRAPQPGELLTIAGYGAGNYRAATGRCTQYVAPSGRHPFEMVEVAARARQGDSGGPIFNSAGELAGVLFGSGGGSTSGSYAGRVQQFLSSTWPPSQEWEYPDSLAAASRATSPKGPLQRLPDNAAPLERAPLERAPDAPLRMTPLPRADNLASTPASAPRGTALPETLENLAPPPVTAATFTWHDIAGDSFFQQCKTFLAILGLFTLLAQVLRMLSPRVEVE